MNEKENNVCQTCGGEKVIPKEEQVWPGETPMADIGSQPCPSCQLNEKEQ